MSLLPIATPRVAPAIHNGTPPHHAIQAHPHMALQAQHFVLTPPHGDHNSTHSVLEITQQPPGTWYKDQFGRKATFEVAVRRVARGCTACADQRHLNVQLLYESGKLVENQNILRVASGLCLNKNDLSVLAIRIMEVSKNHQNQRFRLQISLPPCPLKHLAAGVAGAISEPVLVLSKKNKRPVKSDTDEVENKSVAKLKKSKHVMSPGNSPCSSAFNTPTNRNRAQAPSPPDFDGIDDSMTEDDQWGNEIVRFRQPSQGLCLWANAAFNFMHRLQWQIRLEAEGEAGKYKYQCPACHAVYGSRPMHRPECDLALLLEQTEDTHEHENTEKSNKTSPDKNQRHHDQSKTSHCAPTSSSRPSLTQDLHNGMAPSGNRGLAPPATAFGSTSVDLMAKNLNLGSWEGYSSLSKIMFSLEAGLKQPAEADPFLKVDSKEHKSSDVSMNSLMSAGGNWSFATPPQPGQLSLNLSSILSSVKGLSPDTAAFLQEQEAELTGDASLLRSLSKVSLSDFLPDGSTEQRSASGSGENVRTAVATLATVLTDESKSNVNESAVVAIATVDFHNCGYPAFDASNELVGSYFLSEKKVQPELRFLPNLYPLPPQMLQDLRANLVVWRQQPNVLLHERADSSVQSLAQLKAQVVSVLLKPRPQ